MCHYDGDRGAGPVAALAFLIWELLTTLDDEVEYIWSKPASVWIKWVFLFVRYFSLALQSTARSIDLSLRRVSLDPDALRVWFALEVVSAHLVMTALELVMMARVYALYNRSRNILGLFATILFIENLVVFLSLGLTFPKRPFDPSLLIACLPDSFAWYSIAVVFSQTVLVVLSVYKYVTTAEYRKEKLVVVLVRDGTAAFFAILLMSALQMFWVFVSWPSSYTLYPWFVSFVSSSACRMIINMQKLPTERHYRPPQNMFTTVVPDSSEESHMLDDLLSADTSRPQLAYR